MLMSEFDHWEQYPNQSYKEYAIYRIHWSVNEEITNLWNNELVSQETDCR